MALGVSAVGCAGPESSSRAPSGTPTRTPAGEYASVFAAVSKVRGLEPEHAVRIEHLDDDSFAGRTGPLGAAGARGAVYEASSHAILVKRSAEATEGSELEVAAAYHSLLLDDHFGTARTTSLDGEAAAVRAELVAADWALVLRGIRALERGDPIARSIVGSSFAPVSGMLGIIRPPGEARTAPRFLAPSGLSFLADLHRTAGFRLVDAVLSRPPTDARALFDAQAWVDGLERATFDLPRLDPTAEERVVVESFGAAQLAGALARANVANPDAFALSRTLRYGTLEILRSARGDVPARIVLVFDDGAHATNARDLFARATELPMKGEVIGAKERVVVIAWGGATIAERRLADALAVVPGVRRDPPPLGALRLAPPPPLDPSELAVTEVRGDVFVAPNLGLRIAPPAGFHPRSEPHGLAEFEIPSRARLAVSVSSDSSRDGWVALYLEALAHGATPRALDVPRAEQPPPPWLRNDFGVGRIHVAFVTHPVCKKRGLLGVVVAGDDASASSGAQWAGSLDLSSLEASAYCAAVAEQHSEWTFPVKWPPNAASR